MDSQTPAKILRIFISNTDKFKNEPLYEVIIYAAKRNGLAGATALRGQMGYGASSHVSNLRFWEVTEKIPIVIEIVDESSKIDNFIEIIKPFFDKVQNGCLITVEDIHIVLSKPGTKGTKWF